VEVAADVHVADDRRECPAFGRVDLVGAFGISGRM